MQALIDFAPSGVEYFPAVQLRQPESVVRFVMLLHLPDVQALHLNFPTSSWYSPGLHESQVVLVLGLMVMKPTGQLSHRKESSFVVIFFAVEESKNVPGKQQNVKPLLPTKSFLPMGAPAHILLHQV
jgi:hypothetical protein